MLTIGAGGGSLAWIDDGGSLRNGPQSAGAEPGPACYGQGGEEPTNTDAHVVLGRLGTSLIDGAMSLDRGRAETRAAARRRAAGAGDTEEAAEAVLAVANANMADAIRLISVRRGYDPREFALVCFGGAGPLHGAELARELSIPTVLVPPNPGTTSALGCLLVDVRHDLFTMMLGDAGVAGSRAGGVRVRRAGGAGAASACARRACPRTGCSCSARSTCATRASGARSRCRSSGRVESLDALRGAFEDEHEREHSYRRESSPVEVYRLNLRAVGVTQKAELARHEPSGSLPEPVETRPRALRGRGVPTTRPCTGAPTCPPARS